MQKKEEQRRFWRILSIWVLCISLISLAIHPLYQVGIILSGVLVLATLFQLTIGLVSELAKDGKQGRGSFIFLLLGKALCLILLLSSIYWLPKETATGLMMGLAAFLGALFHFALGTRRSR